MNKSDQCNDLEFIVYFSEEKIFIERKPSKDDKLLVIERVMLNTYFDDLDVLKNKFFSKSIKIKGIIGIISIFNLDYLLMIKEHTIIAKINNKIIYKIKDIVFHPLTNNHEKIDSKTNNTINGITNYIMSGFYYSHNFDLTNTIEKQHSKSEFKDLFMSANRKFLWNYNLCLNLIGLKDLISLSDWVVSAVCGYVGSCNLSVCQINLNLILISRRSIHKAGTRYNTRGIDDDGNVGNYVETEQIAVFNDKVYSYVQLRGSSPIFFEQNEILGKTNICRSVEMTNCAFEKHFDKIFLDYNKILCINLLNKKSSEKSITETYEKLIFMSNKKYENRLLYEFLDYKKAIKESYSLVDNFLSKVEKIFTISYFNSFEAQQKQKNVIRTNCLDSLDRTNLIQTRIGWLALRNMLSIFNLSEEYKKLFQQNFLNPESVNLFRDRFKTLWIENGDVISIQYSGTNSTSSFVAKKGSNGLLGILNTAKIATQRFYEGTVKDEMKQKCINILLQVEKQKILNNNQMELNKKHLTFHFVSWCLSGKEIPLNLDIRELIFPNSNVCDVYVFGFQRIIEINSRSLLLNSNEEAKKKINNKLYNTLKTSDE